MKKVLCLVLALAMVFALAACGAKPAANPADSGTPAAPDAPASTGSDFNLDNVRSQKFVLAHGLPATGMTGMQYHEFCVAVETLSGGKMVVEEKVGGTLLADTETWDAVRDGEVDFIHSMGSYVSGTVNDLSPLTIAGYYAGDDFLGFCDSIRGTVTDIYGDYGVKYLGALYQANSAIVCTEKQIKSPADVKGMTFRASGTWVSKTVEAWGGAATTIGLADLADAFSKKSVAGTATGWNIIVPFKIYEVAKYVTSTTILEGFAALLMNGDRWNSLNADEQAIISAAARVFEEKSMEIGVKCMNDYRKQVEESGLNEIYDLTPEEQAEFVKLAMGLYDEMAPGLGEKGLKLIEILKQANGQ